MERIYQNAGSGGPGYSRISLRKLRENEEDGGVVEMRIDGEEGPDVVLHGEQCRDLAAQLLAIAGAEPIVRSLISGDDFTK